MSVFDQSEFFSDLTDSIKTTIEHGAVINSYGPGESVFRQGEVSDGIYVIKSGTVEITVDVQGAKP